MGVQLVKYGGLCSLLTRVSNDALGKFALNQLDHYGVNRDLIKLEDNESRISFAIVETTIEDHQSIIYRHKAADLFLNKSDIENAKILRRLSLSHNLPRSLFDLAIVLIAEVSFFLFSLSSFAFVTKHKQNVLDFAKFFNA